MSAVTVPFSSVNRTLGHFTSSYLCLNLRSFKIAVIRAVLVASTSLLFLSLLRWKAHPNAVAFKFSRIVFISSDSRCGIGYEFGSVLDFTAWRSKESLRSAGGAFRVSKRADAHLELGGVRHSRTFLVCVHICPRTLVES